jgi:hypothetical protein
MNWMQLAIELTREAMKSRAEPEKPTEPTDLGTALSQQFGLIDRQMEAIVQNLKAHNAKLERSIRPATPLELYPGGRGRRSGGHRISALKACAGYDPLQDAQRLRLSLDRSRFGCCCPDSRSRSIQKLDSAEIVGRADCAWEF